MTADRPLTERERAAVIEDLSRYRVLLADARRELLDFAWCACLACRRERAALALLGPRPNPSAPLGALSGQSKGHSAGAAAQVKKIYVALAEDVAAEIPTRLAGIRALEADLDLGGAAMMRLRLCRALWRWLARPLAVFKAGFWMRYWLAANERNEHLGDRIEQLQEDILILRQRFDEERMEKELAQAFAKSAYAEARQAREQLEAIKAGSRN